MFDPSVCTPSTASIHRVLSINWSDCFQQSQKNWGERTCTLWYKWFYIFQRHSFFRKKKTCWFLLSSKTQLLLQVLSITEFIIWMQYGFCKQARFWISNVEISRTAEISEPRKTFENSRLQDLECALKNRKFGAPL